jgi:uncharacterized membrane protein
MPAPDKEGNVTKGLIRREPVLPRTAHPAAMAAPTRRLEAVDWLRGLVMVVMALDHARDFFSNAHFDPTDLARTTPAYFLTRWVTHFCAPVFVFLAGAGAYLHGSRGMSRPRLARFLLSRGLWLVFLEVTVIHMAWSFSLPVHGVMCQVIWAIGWSMVVLSLLVLLPTSAVTTIGIAIVAFHNTWDGIRPAEWGDLAGLWQVLHTGGVVPLGDHFGLFVMYPVLPWIGVMACGYGFGALLTCEPAVRRRQLLGLGLALTLVFVVLRAINRYGDPHPWSVQTRGPLFTLFSFVDCRKYPPSLLFLLLTLGPSIFALGLMDRRPGTTGALGRILATFGRVPLFYYILHIALIHGAAVGVMVARYGRAGLAPRWGQFPRPETSPYDLLIVYLVWLAALMILYFPCRWFAGVKQRHRAWWLSYL